MQLNTLWADRVAYMRGNALFLEYSWNILANPTNVGRIQTYTLYLP